jgi:hypothetical protein
MSYSDQLCPWVVYRLLPNCQRLMMERFRKRNNAEDYVRVIRQMQPHAQFEIVFETYPNFDAERVLGRIDRLSRVDRFR